MKEAIQPKYYQAKVTWKVPVKHKLHIACSFKFLKYNVVHAASGIYQRSRMFSQTKTNAEFIETVKKTKIVG